MPPVPSAKGLGNPRSSRRNKSKPKQVPRSQMKAVALSLKDTKKHSSTVANFQLWAGGAPFMVIKPLSNLDMSATNSETQRESNMVYAMNSRLDLTITPHEKTLHPIHLRVIKGWAKGNATYGATQTPIDQVSEANLAQAIPSHTSEIDSDDFKLLMDKTYTIAPRQIYDSDTANEGAHDNSALWKDFKFKHNWKFDRKYKYEDQYGTSLVGWVPFIAIQLDRSIFGSAFTGANGSTHPSPIVQYNFDTYFKDIN